MFDVIKAIADKNKEACKDDYVNADGLLMCSKCNSPKQCELEFPPRSNRFRKFPIMCKCEQEKEHQLEENNKRIAWEKRLARLYQMGLCDKAYMQNTFEKDDNRNPSLTLMCKKYVNQFEKLRQNGYGILFYGDTGGGKSFYACCIANALIKKGVRVLVSRLSDLVKNRVDDSVSDVRLSEFELVILDDIGTENYSQTAYNIIDDIYRCGMPLIVTTNLTPNQLKNPDSIEQQRIFDRVIERCCLFAKTDVPKSRLDMARKNREQALKILNE